MKCPPEISLAMGIILLFISAFYAYNELENEKEQIENSLTGKLDVEITDFRKDKIQNKDIFYGVPYIVWEVGVVITNRSGLKNISIKKVWIERSKDGEQPAILERERLSRYGEVEPYLQYRISKIEDHPYLEPRRVISGDFIFLDPCGFTKEHLDGAYCIKNSVVLIIEDDEGNIYKSILGER